jgi:hypothetical protein
VERALTLVATGMLTVTMAQAARGKVITLPQTLNLSTGKDSMCQTGFSDTAWGKASQSYAKSASALSNAKINTIVEDAWKYVNPVRACNRGSTATVTTETNIVGKDDEHTCLIDNLDSDLDLDTDSDSDASEVCESLPFLFSFP